MNAYSIAMILAAVWSLLAALLAWFFVSAES
jgi:hypothetical protein